LRLGAIENKPNIKTEIVDIPINGRIAVHSFNFNGDIFTVGESVLHPRFGEGQLIQIQAIKENEAIFTINFNNGQKQLLAKFAKLSKIIAQKLE
jgi:hypothetical protein